MTKPVYILNEGIPKGVYLRAGSSTRRANEDYIKELERDARRITYDEEVVHTNCSSLSNALLKKVYSKVTQKKLLLDKVITPMHSNQHEYFPTVAGILWFHENPDSCLHVTHIRCTKFSGISGRDIIQTNEISGDLGTQIDLTFELIKSWLLRNFSLQGAKLVGKMLVPAEALREAIINAVIHRKYSIPGAIKIALYENRLEIFSPGCFPGLININNLGDGTTYLRNPIIAKIARRLGYIEQLGTGISLIKSSCRKANLIEPDFIEGEDSVKVVFKFIPTTNDNDEVIDAILNNLYNADFVTVSGIVNTTGVSRNTATRKLNALIKQGKVFRVGKGPSVKYLLNEKR